jgi:hypothetical protein
MPSPHASASLYLADGETIGHALARSGYDAMLAAWCDTPGNDLHAVTPDGWTIGHMASTGPCLRVWHDRGGDIHALVDGKSIMDIAMSMGTHTAHREACMRQKDLCRAWIDGGGCIADGYVYRRDARYRIAADMTPGSYRDHARMITHVFLRMIRHPDAMMPLRAWEDIAFASPIGQRLAERFLPYIDDPLDLAQWVQRMTP